MDTQARRPSKKLQPKYIGPYKILKVISPVTYKLKLPPTLTIHSVFYISLLKPYQENPLEFASRLIKPLPPFIVEEQEEYEVDRILDKRIHKRGRASTEEYLVKWKGYSDYDATWEPASNLQNAKEAIQDFEDMLGQHS